jgi:hypothetical protein
MDLSFMLVVFGRCALLTSLYQSMDHEINTRKSSLVTLPMTMPSQRPYREKSSFKVQRCKVVVVEKL